jgi:hypothetical protein
MPLGCYRFEPYLKHWSNDLSWPISDYRTAAWRHSEANDRNPPFLDSRNVVFFVRYTANGVIHCNVLRRGNRVLERLRCSQLRLSLSTSSTRPYINIAHNWHSRVSRGRRLETLGRCNGHFGGSEYHSQCRVHRHRTPRI